MSRRRTPMKADISRSTRPACPAEAQARSAADSRRSVDEGDRRPLRPSNRVSRSDRGENIRAPSRAAIAGPNSCAHCFERGSATRHRSHRFDFGGRAKDDHPRASSPLWTRNVSSTHPREQDPGLTQIAYGSRFALVARFGLTGCPRSPWNSPTLLRDVRYSLRISDQGSSPSRFSASSPSASGLVRRPPSSPSWTRCSCGRCPTRFRIASWWRSAGAGGLVPGLSADSSTTASRPDRRRASPRRRPGEGHSAEATSPNAYRASRRFPPICWKYFGFQHCAADLVEGEDRPVAIASRCSVTACGSGASAPRPRRLSVGISSSTRPVRRRRRRHAGYVPVRAVLADPLGTVGAVDADRQAHPDRPTGRSLQAVQPIEGRVAFARRARR